jgi:uncharacterized protein YggE
MPMYNGAKIDQPWGVSTFGAASASGDPDVVRLQVGLSQVEQTPGEAFQAARGVVAAFRAVLRSHDIPDAGVSPSRIKLATHWEYDRRADERVHRGYKCTANFEFETTAIDSVQDLIVQIVDAGMNVVDDIEFDVRAKPELRARARREAIAAARAKAELYAEAAGVRLGRVLHIQDVDPEQLRIRSHGTLVGGLEEDFAPGRIVVGAAVAMGFAIED